MAHLNSNTNLVPRMMGMHSNMMKMSPEMMQSMMPSGTGKNTVQGATKVLIVTKGAANFRHTLLGSIIRHPYTLIGLGLVAGYLMHKYREQTKLKSDIN